MKVRVAAFVRCLAKPVVSQYALFVTALLLLGKSVIRALLFIPFDGFPQEGFLTAAGNVFLQSYLIVLIVYLSKSLVVKLSFYTLLFALFFVGEFLKNVFLKSISSEVLMLLGETTQQEVREFFGEYLLTRGTFLSVATTLFFILLACLLEKKKAFVARLLPQRMKSESLCGTVVLVFLLWGMVSSMSYVRMARCQTLDRLALWELDEALYADPVTHVASACYGVSLMAQETERFVRVTESSCLQTPIATDSDSLNVIVVIGESYIKWHSNLYGYPLNTCPYQKAEADSGRLYALNRVYTTSNFTSLALKDLFSCNSTSAAENWDAYPFFPAIIKQADYDVYMWDNQRTTFSALALTFSLNSYLYNDRIQQLSYDATNTQSYPYDAELITDYTHHVKRKNGRNLIFFHLMGQHFDASNRYPQEKKYQFFNEQDIRRRDAYLTKAKRQEIADYDNATRYNDLVLKQVFDMYRDEPTIVISLSDHGEEIYDFRDSKGRSEAGDYPAQMMKYQYQVPFVIWCSDAFQQQRPEEMQRIRQAVDKSYNIDDLCHLLFRLCGVKTPYYQQKLDPLSPQYRKDSPSVLSNPQHFIAHACGEIDGHTYTNSLEALQKSIASGYRYIEFDLAETSDNVLVCSHGFEDFPDDSIPSLKDFKEHRIKGRYTPMTLDDAIRLWRQSSFVFVTDKISDTLLLNRHFRPAERRRVFVETPFKANYRALEAAGYVPMFCLHHFNMKAFLYYLKLRVFDGLNIKRLVVHTDSSPTLLNLLRRWFGVKVAMYTSNSSDFFLRHLDHDADLIYTDNWDLSKEQPYNDVNLNTY